MLKQLPAPAHMRLAAPLGDSDGHPPLLGVLGGMGPSATIDFMQKVVRHTNARCDQDHIPLLVASIPQIPDRTAGIQELGPSPAPAMLASARRLVDGGAELIVIPCNTAHFWYDELQQALPVPMLHLIDCALDEIPLIERLPSRIGLLATAGTIGSGLYEARTGARSRAGAAAVDWIYPTLTAMQDWVSPAVLAAKSGNLDSARRLLALAASALVHRGAEAIVLGCTEIPLALTADDVSAPLIDATEALARRAVAWARGKQPAAM